MDMDIWIMTYKCRAPNDHFVVFLKRALSTPDHVPAISVKSFENKKVPFSKINISLSAFFKKIGKKWISGQFCDFGPDSNTAASTLFFTPQECMLWTVIICRVTTNTKSTAHKTINSCHGMLGACIASERVDKW